MASNIKRKLYNVHKISSDDRPVYIIEDLKVMYSDRELTKEYHGGASGMIFVELYDDDVYKDRVLGLYYVYRDYPDENSEFNINFKPLYDKDGAHICIKPDTYNLLESPFMILETHLISDNTLDGRYREYKCVTMVMHAPYNTGHYDIRKMIIDYFRPKTKD